MARQCNRNFKTYLDWGKTRVKKLDEELNREPSRVHLLIQHNQLAVKHLVKAVEKLAEQLEPLINYQAEFPKLSSE